MSYGSHGIQQKRRLLEIGEETASITGECRKGKGKTPEQKERDKRRKAEIRELKKTGQYTASKKAAPSWFQCSCCMARAGIGSHKAGKIIGVSPSTVTRQWNDFGIRAEIPSHTGWRMIARKARTAQKKADEAPFKAYNEAAMQEIRQHRSKSVYPCWSVLLRPTKDPDYARKKALQYYHALTVEQKKARNRALQQKRKQCPVAMEKQRENVRKWKRNNPEKNLASVRKSIANRKRRDPGFRIQCNMRDRFKDIMGIVRDPSKKWNSQLVGCSTTELATHLERKFNKGMTWQNYGTHWHVDHIIPCSKFDHMLPHHVRQCWHYSNLQPLWAADNLAKSDSIDSDTQLSLTL